MTGAPTRADRPPGTGPGTNPTALVTGGSKGIGRSLASEFAADGYDLLLVARTKSTLEEVAAELEYRYGVGVDTLSVDLAKRAAVDRIVDYLTTTDTTVDALVNNAAVATYGAFAECDLETERDQLRVNVEAPVLLTRRLLPALLERDSGIVLNVASTAGLRPGPYMAGYHASKSYLVSFTQSVAEECRATGVSVAVLCPGPVSTDIHDESGRGSTWLERRFMLSPDRVAAAGYRGVKRGDVVVIPGYRNRVIPAICRVLPWSLRRRLGAWVTTPGVVPRPK